MSLKVRNLVALCAVFAALSADAATAVSGSCESKAVSIGMTATGAMRAVALVDEYDADDKENTGRGVYYFKATLKRGNAYTVWTEGVSADNPVYLDAYAADPKDDDDFGPGAGFDDVGETGADTRLVMYADDWTVDDEDPEFNDPSSWTYYFVLEGAIGASATVWFRQGVVTPSGREDTPVAISPAGKEATTSRKLELGGEYHFKAKLTAGRLYHFATGGGTAEMPLNVSVGGSSDDVPDVDVYNDPAFDGDDGNTGVYVVPSETDTYPICVFGDADGSEGGAFSLSYRQFPARAPAEHAFATLDDSNGWMAQCAPGFMANWKANDAYDAVIDEALFAFTAEKGRRFVCETLGAATNLLMRVYDAKGNVLAENDGDGESTNVRCAFEATAAGTHYVGVCQDMVDEFAETPAYLPVTVKVSDAASVDGEPDEWDPSDDTAAGATALAPIPGNEGDDPAAADAEGHGPHLLGRTDWSDVFVIGARKGVVYSLRASRDAATASSLGVEVFTMNGTKEKEVAFSGGLDPSASGPLKFTATANAAYYVRVGVAQGAGLDYPAYRIHATAWTTNGVPLGVLTVKMNGVPGATWSLNSETVKYPSGASVLVSGTNTVKFSSEKGFATPSAQKVVVAPGAAPTVVEVNYSDTSDPKDDAPKGATAITLKTAAATWARTLWADDPADHFSLSGKDGQLYDFALADVTGDAVFTITNATPSADCPDGVFARGVTEVSHLALPTAKTKYFLIVHHGNAESPVGGSYTLSGLYANVGAIKFAKTAVSVKDSAASVSISVNRTAKDGRVRVRYGTVAGTATPGKDYVAQSGVLEWASGDSKAKTITVGLVPELVSEWAGARTFGVELRALEEDELDADEYAAAFSGVRVCTVTIAETAKAGTTAESVYAAAAPKRATVAKGEAAALETGTFYGVLAEDGSALTNGLPALASVTFTASTAATPALSAKVAIAGKTYSFSAKGWDEAEDGEETPEVRTRTLTHVQKVAGVAYTNTLVVSVDAGRTDAGGDWLCAGATADLEMNVPDANNKGVQEDIRYVGRLARANDKIQGYLDSVTNFAGYYTVALVPEGDPAADGVPAGSGYLTLTVDNKGGVKVAGMLADGATKPSLSVKACAVVEDAASLNGYAMLVPVFFAKSPQCFGGTLRLYAVADEENPDGSGRRVVVDSSGLLLWNNDSAAATYDNEDGFRLSVSPAGGWYDKIVNLQAWYLTRDFSVETAASDELPAEAFASGYAAVDGVGPDGTEVGLAGNAFSTAKKALVKSGKLTDLAASVNPCNVQLKFTRATGIVTGSFSVWSETEDSAAQKEVAGFKHNGVVLLSRSPDAPLSDEIVSAGAATKSLSWKVTNPDTKRSVTRKWTWSAPFNLIGVDRGDVDWWADDWGEPAEDSAAK